MPGAGPNANTGVINNQFNSVLSAGARLTARAIDGLSTIAGSLCGYSMVFISFATFYEIVARGVFRSPTDWVFDISCYITVWFGFMAAAFGLEKGSHIQVDFLLSRMGQRTLSVMNTWGYLVTAVFTAILTYYGLEMTGESMRSGEVTANVLYIKVWVIQAGIFVGGLLMFLQCIKLVASHAAGAWKNRSQPVSGFFDNPYLVVPFFIALVALGAWMLTVNGLLGMIILLLAFLFSGVPVFASLAMTGVLGFFMVFHGVSNWPMVPVIALRSLNDYTLVALPVFILGAQMLEHSKIGDQLFTLCTKWVGHLPGGLAIATVIACAIFSAISGSSVATAATIGIIAIPAMISRGYNPRLAAGVLAAAGTLGILIPPSGPMIIYSSITDESTGALFMAGILPGLLLTALFALYVYLYCRRTGQYQPEERSTWRERFIAFKESAWGLLTPVIILGGIYTGLFTPLEAAAVMVIYALIVSIATGSLKLKDIPHVMALSTRSSSMILMIIAGAMIMGTVFTMLQVPQKATEFIATAQIPVWGVIAGIMALLLIMGMFLDVVSILLITVPILYPIITSLGLNGIWFAVLLVINMEMAVITPPVGLNLYVIKAMTRINLVDIVRGVFPFFIIIVLLLVITALYTPLSLWLPSTMK